MLKPKDPRNLAISLLNRSVCAVQVAAVLADRWGVYSWGWNNSGRDGFGEHAEEACLRRINRSRAASNSTLYVASRRKRNGRTINSRPCERCSSLISRLGINKVIYRDREGWHPNCGDSCNLSSPAR